jgi:uncharacterized coiled-coil DUF342 family protein
VGEKKPGADDAPGRLAELRDRVERATKLIAELREANYSLSSELAELQRKLAAHPPSPPAAAAPAPSRELHEELQQLRDERKIIRAKVQNLLERIERIEL